MAVLASQALSLLVHQVRKGLPGAGYMLSQGIGALVGGGQEEGVETVPDRQLIPLIDPGAAAPFLYIVNCIVGEGDHLIQVAVLQDDQGGKDLGDAGGIVGFMNIFSIENRSRVRLHDNSPICLNGNVFRPADRGFGGYGTEEKRKNEAEGKNAFYHISYSCKIRRLR